MTEPVSEQAAPQTSDEKWRDCSHCIGQCEQMPDGIWVHEDGKAGCYSAMPNLAFPHGVDRPSDYERRAAPFWETKHPQAVGL